MATGLAGFTACSDSDDGNNGGTTPEQKSELTEAQLMQREAVATVLNELTGETFSDTTDIDFEGHTYEATIGEVRNDSRPSERSLQVRTAALAEGYFRSLVGGASDLITETADDCKIDLTNLDCHSTGRKQNLGTLTFHRASGGDNVGYADIDIACIPGLQRISYKTRDQWGDNEGFKSPIRWGEIFVGAGGRYWVCAKEAYGYHPDQAGVLINMQPGKSDNWKPIYDDGADKWAAWCPSEQILTPHYGKAILDYVDLCGSGEYAAYKSDYKTYFGEIFKKVFPIGQTWTYSNAEGYWVLSPGTSGPGFADTNPDNADHWCHIAGYPVTHGVIIVRDATEGDYRAGHGQWRRWHIWCTDVDNENGMENARMRGRTYNMANSSALHEYTFHYTNTNDFNRFAEYAIIYTARGIAFTTEIPKGLTKLDLPN
jgi:hypothetical protein